jgi:hypothetical protein
MKKLLPLLFILSGCADGSTYMKNEKTAGVVECGGYQPVTLAGGVTVEYALRFGLIAASPCDSKR